jgi:hypothetical protein
MYVHHFDSTLKMLMILIYLLLYLNFVNFIEYVITISIIMVILGFVFDCFHIGNLILIVYFYVSEKVVVDL